jgi:hypothetical protein
MPAVREVAFHLERFEWAEDRLEVAGRWQGLAGRRLTRPVLTIQLGERRKRIVAVPGDHAQAEDWLAEFPFAADPAEIVAAELEVGRSVVVELPLPDKRRRRRRRPTSQETGEVLRAEAGALRGQVERLRAELAGREREIMQLKRELDALDTEERAALAAAGTQEHQALPQLEQATVEIARVAAERDAAVAESERAAAERDALREDAEKAAAAGGDREQALVSERDAARAQAAAERERREREVGELREAFAEAAAEAESTRDRHRAETEQLNQALETERAEADRLRDELGAARAAAARLRRERAAPAGPDTAETPTARRRAAAPPTEPMEPPAPPVSDDTTVEDPDAPGLGPAQFFEPPLRTGDPPPESQPFGPRAAAAVASVREWLEARTQRSNGHVDAAEIPLPVQPRVVRRSAAPARARAEASVHARRHTQELWGVRIVAAVLVALLLLAFILLVSHFA